jgi:hypothetical protein
MMAGAWVFGAALTLAGCTLAWANAAPSLGAFTGAAIEAGFGVAIFAATRAGVAAAGQQAPARLEADATL